MKTKPQIPINKPVYLDLSMLEINKIIMYEFWHGYVKPTYGEKAKLYYIETDSIVLYIKAEDIHIDIEKDVATRCDTGISELERLLP